MLGVTIKLAVIALLELLINVEEGTEPSPFGSIPILLKSFVQLNCEPET